MHIHACCIPKLGFEVQADKNVRAVVIRLGQVPKVISQQTVKIIIARSQTIPMHCQF